MASRFGKGKIVASGFMFLCWPLVTGAAGLRSNLNDRIVAAHNRERATLGISRLEWSDDLARGAKEWADHLARTGDFAHSPNLAGHAREGENLWAGTTGAYSPEAMVALWVSEKRFFVPGTFPENSRTGRVEAVSHYTQLVWRRTGEVGCALSSGTKEDILVCRYSEAGNIIGEKMY